VLQKPCQITSEEFANISFSLHYMLRVRMMETNFTQGQIKELQLFTEFATHLLYILYLCYTRFLFRGNDSKQSLNRILLQILHVVD
jgi:hypothetical protein